MSSVSLSMMIAKRNGLSAEPWWSPTPTLNSLVNPAELLTVVVAPSYISWIIFMYHSDVSANRKHSYSSSLGTLSYTFSRSIKAQCTAFCPSVHFSNSILRQKIASVVLLPGMNPNCCSAIVTSFLILASIILSHNFIVWLMNLIVR